MRRRDFIRYLLAGSAGSAVLGGKWPGALSKHFGGRAAAQPSGLPRPTIYILFHGGLDSAITFDCRPSVKRPDDTPAYQVRDVGEGDVERINSMANQSDAALRAEVFWNRSNLATYMGSHIEDMSIIGGVRADEDHAEAAGELWWGESNIQGLRDGIVKTQPFTNHLASELNKRLRVPLPNVGFISGPDDSDENAYHKHNNTAADPLAAFELIPGAIGTFVDSKKTPPKYSTQYKKAIADHISALDQEYFQNGGDASASEEQLRSTEQVNFFIDRTIPDLWTPGVEQLESARGYFDQLTDQDLLSGFDHGVPLFGAQCLLALQLARFGLSHSIMLQTGFIWDSHSDRKTNQMERYMEQVGRLLTGLKSEPALDGSGQSLFDQVQVVLTSDFTRSAPQEGTGQGTSHTVVRPAYCWGGGFKRGAMVGQHEVSFDEDPKGILKPARVSIDGRPAAELTSKQLLTTVMAAAGVDPSGWNAEGDEDKRPIKQIIREDA